MLLLNHKYFHNEIFENIEEIIQIKDTKSNSTVVFDYNEKNINLCLYCRENDLAFALKIDSIEGAIFGNNFGAKYLFLEDNKFASETQKIAENYMFDSKIILLIDNKKEIEKSAILGIDGVFFK